MSSLSNYLKQLKQRDEERFFGETKHKSNAYFAFKRVIDDDNVIVITSNVKRIRDSYVLIVDNDKAIFLKDWQIRPVRVNLGSDTDACANSYAIKLNRNFMRTYTFKSGFDGYDFEKEEGFDDFVELAREQEADNATVAQGHAG